MSVALKDAVEQMQESLRSNPDSALAKFSADSRQVQGLQSETKIRQFTLTVDEPENLGGTDTGPNPVELILGALASCQEITYRAFAEALEIPLDSVSVRIEGDLDLRGFFAVDNSVRAGFQNIRGIVELAGADGNQRHERNLRPRALKQVTLGRWRRSGEPMPAPFL
jgi:uncharacterized OsmC-like protein